MGTRHLTIVALDGDYKVAQYGQWDGYPSGQGETIVKFLKTVALDRFREQVRLTKTLTSEEIKARWKACGADDTGFVNGEVAEAFKEKNAQLSRDCGAEILDYIMITERPEIGPSQIEFAADSLFCEWAYVVNLDANLLEVYKGFNQEPLRDGERFKYLTERCAKEKDTGKPKYYPVKELISIPFSELTDEIMSKVESINSEEEKEEVAQA